MVYKLKSAYLVPKNRKMAAILDNCTENAPRVYVSPVVKIGDVLYAPFDYGKFFEDFPLEESEQPLTLLYKSKYALETLLRGGSMHGRYYVRISSRVYDCYMDGQLFARFSYEAGENEGELKCTLIQQIEGKWYEAEYTTRPQIVKRGSR